MRINIFNLAAIVMFLLETCPSFALNTTAKLGITASYDNDVRNASADNEEDIREDETIQRIVISPIVTLNSESKKTLLSLSVSPKIKYDLDNSDTDLDAQISFSGQRSLDHALTFGLNDVFVRSDYAEDAAGSISGEAFARGGEDSSLLQDLGRRQYWRNRMNVFSDYRYGNSRKVVFDLSQTILRNSQKENSDYEDYDRYSLSISSMHSFNKKWQFDSEVIGVRGLYDSNDKVDDTELTDTQYSEPGDLVEYHVAAKLINRSITPGALSLNYRFIGTYYDDQSEYDGNVQQFRLLWEDDLSRKWSVLFGGGASYDQSAGEDGTWGGNGIVGTTYRSRYSSLQFTLEKRFDVNNFSGTGERGFVDLWELAGAGNYRISEDWLASADTTYLSQDKEGRVKDWESYHENRLTVGAGLTYSFAKYFDLSINYTFTSLDSDLVNSDYTDHRVLLSFSVLSDVFSL